MKSVAALGLALAMAAPTAHAQAPEILPNENLVVDGIPPVNNAAKITRPLFVVQGRNDPRVPLHESEQVVATVKNGTPVWYLMAKDEGHGFAKKKNLDFQFYAAVAFMEEYLLR